MSITGREWRGGDRSRKQFSHSKTDCISPSVLIFSSSISTMMVPRDKIIYFLSLLPGGVRGNLATRRSSPLHSDHTHSTTRTNTDTPARGGRTRQPGHTHATESQQTSHACVWAISSKFIQFSITPCGQESKRKAHMIHLCPFALELNAQHLKAAPSF